MDGKIISAVYSAKAAALYGSNIYRAPGGKEVEITCVGATPANYHWSDATAVGPVFENGWLRKGQTGSEVERLREAYKDR